MKCSNCGYENIAGSAYCSYCNNALNAGSATAVTTATVPTAPAAPTPPTTSASYSTPSSSTATSTASTTPSYGQPYYYYQPLAAKEKQPFSLTDAYIIIGFVLAIIGIFAYSFLLLPISIGFSIFGFVKRTNTRTHGLSVAGIVVGVVACLIKIGMVLHELGLIPDWLSAGIF